MRVRYGAARFHSASVTALGYGMRSVFMTYFAAMTPVKCIKTLAGLTATAAKNVRAICSDPAAAAGR